MNRKTPSAVRRRPKQRRSIQTVDAILDAVLRIVKREGLDAVTTNRIAEVAGVSIGSLYQYFPDKRAIFIALHRRHIEQIDRIIGTTLVEHAASSLDDLVRALVEAMLDTHSTDPELFEVLGTQVPHRADGSLDFASRLHGAFRLALSSRLPQREARSPQRKTSADVKTDTPARKTRGPSREQRTDIDKIVFIVTNMVEALCHAAALRRPQNISPAAAKEEIVCAILAYVHS
jgi:AcrR family transcriptional regulator